MNQHSVTNNNAVKEKAQELGFHKAGITAVEAINTDAQRLQAWITLGYHADMEWMNNPKRQDISLVMPEARSLVCVALNYYTPHQRPGGKEYAKISRYGWGRDYHKVLHKLPLWLGERLSQSAAQKTQGADYLARIT